MLAKMIFLALVGMIFAFNVPATVPKAECAPRATPTMNLDFMDAALDNLNIVEDPSAQPPKKCQMCFG